MQRRHLIHIREEKTMKKIMLFVLALCMCFTAFGTVLAETAATEAPAAEKPAAEMTGEELYQAGKDAFLAEDYGKALEYFQLAADAGQIEACGVVGALYEAGVGVEQDYGKAMEYFLKGADLGDTVSLYALGELYFFGEGVELSDGGGRRRCRRFGVCRLSV